MASTTAGRIRNAALTLNSENQSLIADMRKAFATMKEIARDLERDDQSLMVKELENGLAELVEAYEDCQHQTSAIHSVTNAYQLGPQLTDFKKLLDDELAKRKASSSSDPQNHPFMRQFREAVWNVHHQGQPMPGDDDEDIIMTSTQSVLLNVTCPLTGRPVIELQEPVRSMDCKHIYEKKAIMQHMNSRHFECPVAACPKVLAPHRLVCDPLLMVDIDEMRKTTQQTTRHTEIEDFTAFSEDD